MTLTHSDAPPKMASWSILIATGLMVFAWLVLNYPALQWLIESFSDTSVFNLIIFGVVATVLLIQAIHHRRKLGLSATAILHPAPLILMFGSTVTGIGLQWLLDVPQIGVLLFAIASYGLIGLFIAPNVWRKGLPSAILYRFGVSCPSNYRAIS